MARLKKRITEHQLKELFAKNLRVRLAETNLSQTELAKRMSTERTAINRWAKGHQSPNFETLASLCTHLGVPPSYFLRGPDTL